MDEKSSYKPADLPDGRTKFCFLFGRDILGSSSPAMHTRWFREHNLNCVYLSCPLTTENSFTDFLRRLIDTQGFLGANITLPFKRTALNLEFAHLSEQVKTIGAANTIYRNNAGQWHLENTDAKGIDHSIEHLIPAGEAFSILLLGGGGAAAAAMYCGARHPNCLNIVCFTREPEKTYLKFPMLRRQRKIAIHKLTEKSVGEYLEKKPFQNKKILLINSLPLGRKGTEAKNIYAINAIKHLDIAQDCYLDMISGETEATDFANEKGLKHLDGRLMLKVQAQESFFLWTGIKV